MIYPANFEQKIGFDRLREQVAALCTMRAARVKLAEETFSASAREIGRRLELADQMRLLLDMEHDFPGGEYPDVDHVVAKLRVEGTFLDVGEVVTLHRAMSLVGSVVAFILAREGQYPALYARSRGVEAFPGIVQRIDAIVDRFGNIRDNASPALLEIRRAIREREGQAAKRLQAVLAAAKGAGIVDADAQISIREGKAVIPVAAANKRKLQGFIHDESATGRTFYVEPVEVVEINNELRELEYAERQEILKKAKLEAQQLIADANRQIENTIRTIREAQAEKELTRLARRELDDFRDAVAKADTADKDAEVAREIERIERRRQRREERKAQRGEAQAAGAAPAEAPKPREVEAGSKVRMAGQDMVGVVQSVKGRKAQVAFGQILTTVDRKMLTVVSNSEFREATRPQTARTVVSADISARKLSFKDHIDVRGMRAAEALDAVQDFIDDALMVGVGSVSILHGKGTGALKEEIRRYLRTVPEVESARDEHADRGGAGITIVTFDLS